MPTGGIIFLTILALWAFYLVPVLVKERASRLDSRAGDRTSPAVRVLKRPPAQRPSHRVVLTADRPVVSDDLPARPTRDLAVRLRAEARTARVGVRARAAAAAVGVLALLVAVLSSALGALPWWTVGVAGAWLAAVVVNGAVAASGRRRASATPVGRTAALPPRAHRVATEVFDGRVARAPVPAMPLALTPADAARSAAAGQGGAWTPVEVPSPVYASKPVSHRPPALPWSMPPVAPQDDVATCDDVAAGADLDPRDGSSATAGGSADQHVGRADGRQDGQPDDQSDEHAEERRSESA